MSFGLSKVFGLSSIFKTSSFNPGSLVTNLNGFWLRANKNVTDGGDSIIESWAPSKGSYGNFVQSIPNNKPSKSTINSLESIEFDTDEFLINDLAATNWKWLHASTGCTAFVVARFSGGSSTQHFFDTCNNNIFQHGINIGCNASNGLVSALVTNGSGTAVVSAFLLSTLTSGDLAIIEFSWSQAAGFSLRVNGGSPHTGSITGTPSTNDPSGSPRIGTLVVGTVQFLNGDICEVLIVPGVLSLSQSTNIREYFSSVYSIPLV